MQKIIPVQLCYNLLFVIKLFQLCYTQNLSKVK